MDARSHVGGLDARIGLTLGALGLDADLAVGSGEVLALLGPNGAGKTTVLRVLAGLQPIDTGRVALDGEVLDEPTTGSFLQPERRRVGVVFQDHLLFPHLDLTENVAFGLRARGTARGTARAAALEQLGRFGLAELASSRPRQVSGGQAQRAALARALVTDPALLLLDEPLSALDVGTRAAVRRDLRRHLGEFGGATVLVTHDALDALALADRVAVVDEGRIVQTGTVAEVTSTPRTPYVADLMGLNLLRGRALGSEVDVESGEGTDGAAATVIVTGEHDGPVLVLVRPSSVTLHVPPADGSPDDGAPRGSSRNRWRGRVTGLDLLGDRVRVRVSGPVPLAADVTTAAVAELGIVEGVEVWCSVKATDVTVVDL